MKNSDLIKIFNFLLLAGKLKSTYRFSANPKMKGDSSADHTWRLVLLAMLAYDALKLKLNLLSALKIAVVHDLPEAITGDIDYRLIANKQYNKKTKQKREEAAIVKLAKALPAELAKEIVNLWHEYELGKSEEAKFIKALDKIETNIQTLEMGGGTFDQPELILNYADKHVKNFTQLKPFHKILKDKLKNEFIKHKLEWKPEYDNN